MEGNIGGLKLLNSSESTFPEFHSLPMALSVTAANIVNNGQCGRRNHCCLELIYEKWAVPRKNVFRDRF